MPLSRREAVQWLTVLVGGAISTPVMSALAAGCRAGPSASGWTPEALDPEQLRALELLVDRIIPPTATPGAKDAGVPAFIDKILAEWVHPDERERFLTGLDGLGFTEVAPGEQDALLARLDQEAAQARATGVEPLPFFATLKELTLVGYYTSQAGASEELQWVAVPGRYEGDLPLTEVGRSWA